MISNKISIEAGIPQGSPLSPLLYMFYNSDLLDIPKKEGQSLEFINDITFGVQGLTDAGNAEKLGNWLEKAEIWRRRHGAKFEVTKYLLVHFTKNNRMSTEANITMSDGVTISASPEARYLGVIFNQKLNFKSHLQLAIKKGTKFALAMTRIMKSTWGAHYSQA